MKSTLEEKKAVAIKKITITRAEGNIDTDFVGKPFLTQDWSVADDILIMLSKTAPSEGYDKTDFKIVFEDDFSYTGTFDLVHYSVKRPSLFDHVRGHLEFYAGVRKPCWMDEEQYQRCLYGTDKKEYQEYLNKYLGVIGEVK